MRNSVIRVIITLSMILLMTGNVPADAIVNGASGFAPAKIDEGEEATFSGTIYNLQNISIYVDSLYVEFIEGIISGAQGNTDVLNMSKTYPAERQELPTNSSFTDTFKTEVNYNPGTYNVSIFFMYSNNSDGSSLEKVYSLINQTVIIEGVNDYTRFVIGFAYAVGFAIVIVIGLIVYNNKFKRR